MPHFVRQHVEATVRAEQNLREAIRICIGNTAGALFWPFHGFYVYWKQPWELPQVREKIILISALGIILLCLIASFTYSREWPHALFWATFYVVADVIYWLVYFFGPAYYVMEERG